MSEHFKWSFSADRCLRRCLRQFFLQHVAAWHNAREPLRREAFLLKQVKTLALWQLCDDNLRSSAAAADDDEGQFGDDREEVETADHRLTGVWNG